MNPIRKADVEQLKKLANDLKILKKADLINDLAELIGSPAGISFVDKGTFEDLDFQEALKEEGDPNQAIYESGYFAHFDTDAYGYTDNGESIEIEFADMNDNTKNITLTDLIAKLKSGEWFIHPKEGAQDIIDKLQIISDSLL